MALNPCPDSFFTESFLSGDLPSIPTDPTQTVFTRARHLLRRPPTSHGIVVPLAPIRWSRTKLDLSAATLTLQQPHKVTYPIYSNRWGFALLKPSCLLAPYPEFRQEARAASSVKHTHIITLTHTIGMYSLLEDFVECACTHQLDGR